MSIRIARLFPEIGLMAETRVLNFLETARKKGLPLSNQGRSFVI